MMALIRILPLSLRSASSAGRGVAPARNRRSHKYRSAIHLAELSIVRIVIVDRIIGHASCRSNVRARVEHVFGDQKNGMGTGIVRTIGIVRARCKIGMTNLVYNMRRFIILERMAEVDRWTGARRCTGAC